MTKLTRLAAVLALLASPLAADPAAGTWKTEDGKDGGFLHVVIAPCGSALCGTIDKAFDGTGAPSTGYEHLGKRLIWDMVPTRRGLWWGQDLGAGYGQDLCVENAAERRAPSGQRMCRGRCDLSGTDLDPREIDLRAPISGNSRSAADRWHGFFPGGIGCRS